MPACHSPEMIKLRVPKQNQTITWEKSTSSTCSLVWAFTAVVVMTHYLLLIYIYSDTCNSFKITIFDLYSANQTIEITPHKNEPVAGPRRALYIITATYPRSLQLPELTRLAQTLMLVPDLVWIVVDDTKNKSDAVEQLLRRTGIGYVYLAAPMPDWIRQRVKKKKMKSTFLPRGVSNRNRGLDWLRANASSGVFYFADDDNTYDIRIFEEIRSTRRVSMWPVGMLSRGFGSPVVRNGSLTGFYTGWPGKRMWQVDMAGFAVSVEFLLQRPKAKMPYTVGYEEDGFLKSLSPLSLKDVEPKANNCTQIMVWHTQTKPPQGAQMPLKSSQLYADTNILKLYASIT